MAISNVDNAAGSGTQIFTNGATYTANRLYLCLVITKKTGGPSVPSSVVMHNQTPTFTLITGVAIDADRRLDIYRMMPTSTFGPGQTIEINYAAAQDGCFAEIDEDTSSDTTGSNGSGAIIQSNTGTSNSSPVTVTLAAFANANNYVWGGFAYANFNGLTQGAGFTKLGAQTSGGNTLSEMTEWQNANDVSVDATFESGTFAAAGAAVEIKNAVQAAGGAVVSISSMRMIKKVLGLTDFRRLN